MTLRDNPTMRKVINSATDRQLHKLAAMIAETLDRRQLDATLDGICVEELSPGRSAE